MSAPKTVARARQGLARAIQLDADGPTTGHVDGWITDLIAAARAEARAEMREEAAFIADCEAVPLGRSGTSPYTTAMYIARGIRALPTVKP